jgi:hypothetical protein
MPIIAEEPESAFNMNELIESPSVTPDVVNNILSSAPAAQGALNQQQYICPAHPDIDRWGLICPIETCVD